MIAETITTDDRYTIEIHYDQDAGNPLREFDGQPTLVLHQKAEQRFGWTTDEDWGRRLADALERADELAHRWQMRLTPGGAKVTRSQYEQRYHTLVLRWLRAFHGMRVVLPVAALEHSGVTVYLGTGAHLMDPGGWDSGWIGWLFATREQITEWGFDDRPDAELEDSLRACFEEFEAWVEGRVYGYVVKGPGGAEVADDSCWGFYGAEPTKDGDDMRGAFMEVVDSDRAERADDEAEIAEMAAAELGAMAPA